MCMCILYIGHRQQISTGGSLKLASRDAHKARTVQYAGGKYIQILKISYKARRVSNAYKVPQGAMGEEMRSGCV